MGFTFEGGFRGHLLMNKAFEENGNVLVFYFVLRSMDNVKRINEDTK